MSAAAELPAVAAGDVHMHRRGRRALQDALTAVRLGLTIEQVGERIVRLIVAVAGGRQTCSEALGHQEFVLAYKSYEALGPACLPV